MQMMYPGTILDELTPHARVATAIAPFAAAIIMRIAFGRNGLTRWMLTIGTTWFAINVMLAPYSASMRQDILDFVAMLR
jgi:hypothetical protein